VTQHGNREVVTRSIEGPIHPHNYPRSQARAESRAAAGNVRASAGDRVATLAWNTWRHLETWYGITGIGAVYHTINPRVPGTESSTSANHAEDG